MDYSKLTREDINRMRPPLYPDEKQGEEWYSPRLIMLTLMISHEQKKIQGYVASRIINLGLKWSVTVCGWDYWSRKESLFLGSEHVLIPKELAQEMLVEMLKAELRYTRK